MIEILHDQAGSPWFPILAGQITHCLAFPSTSTEKTEYADRYDGQGSPSDWGSWWHW